MPKILRVTFIMGRRSLKSLIIFFHFFLFANLHIAATEIINKNVERVLDLSTQLTKETIKITAADDTGKQFSKYQLVIPGEYHQYLSFISVKDTRKKDLKVQREVKSDATNFNVEFPKAANTHEIFVELVYIQQIQPYPVEIKQSDKQLVKYDGMIYFYSPYKTTEQKTQVVLSSPNVIAYNQTKPYTLSGSKLKYGPYENIEGLTKEKLYIHYENQNPFMTVNRLERTIQISHWGNIAVEESIQITHSGAKLKGSFSRYEFQKDSRSGQSSVKSYKTMLPASAFGVYYRDSNGNISTSNMNILREYVDLELRPRFPLFGGWKTQYIIGYNMPSFEYLFNDGVNYLLKMRLIDHIFDDMFIEEAVIKIILPEGCTSIKLKTPYNVERKDDSLTHTYLDTLGRPTITFTKKNVVENHIANFELTYNFSKVLLLQEPLLLISFVFVIFMLAIICKRLDFSISTHPHKD
ncbi:dolichyl-diphosphooligosaccharide--protein glycosyltransferase subunit 1 [Haematobia irritans]|uniref:Dolichyl-diphosphooligosaccharide--protein glycosyltransferase subunit 1 n=3 Tax=Haematobia irritans TaxID=7368 RepID=A0A1L8EB22_HAEIR